MAETALVCKTNYEYPLLVNALYFKNTPDFKNY